MTILARLTLTVAVALTLSAPPLLAQEKGPVVAIISHPVADYQKWRTLYDEVKPMRDAAGLVSQKVLHAPDDPNMVVLIHEFETLEGAQALFASPELKAAMQDAGVTAPPTVILGVSAD
jgi:quinol monooxygenase YgiN